MVKQSVRRHEYGNRSTIVKSFLKEASKSMRLLAAELFGTLILIFAGTGAIVVNSISQGVITHVGVSFVFGAVVAALIYSLGHISGAHFNPGVTLAFWTSKGGSTIGYISC